MVVDTGFVNVDLPRVVPVSIGNEDRVALLGRVLIEHHAEGEHVAALIEALARGLFRRHVRHRANHDAEAGVDVADRGTLIVCLLMQFREAEVDERRVAVPGDQHIGRFDVPMHDARLVRGGQAIGDAA
jgi:hypothetical protein